MAEFKELKEKFPYIYFLQKYVSFFQFCLHDTIKFISVPLFDFLGKYKERIRQTVRARQLDIISKSTDPSAARKTVATETVPRVRCCCSVRATDATSGLWEIVRWKIVDRRVFIVTKLSAGGVIADRSLGISLSISIVRRISGYGNIKGR